MTTVQKALGWAVLIIATAFYTSYLGLSSGASFGITMGMIGAALATIQSKNARCSKVCK